MKGNCLCDECFHAVYDYYCRARNWATKQMRYNNRLFDYKEYGYKNDNAIVRENEWILLYEEYKLLFREDLDLRSLYYDVVNKCSKDGFTPLPPPKLSVKMPWK